MPAVTEQIVTWIVPLWRKIRPYSADKRGPGQLPTRSSTNCHTNPMRIAYQNHEKWQSFASRALYVAAPTVVCSSLPENVVNSATFKKRLKTFSLRHVKRSC